MDIIGVEGFPLRISIKQAIAILLKMLNVKFEGLNFEVKKGSKTFYINITDNVDPRDCIEKINNIKGKIRLHAFIPARTPYVIEHKLGKKSKKKESKMKAMRNMAIKIPPPPMSKKKMVEMTRNDILYEMQDTYTGLADLFASTNNKLLFELGQAIEDRLRIVVDNPVPALPDSCFLLSKHYRFKYNHDGDLQLIQTCLQRAGGSGELTLEDLKPHPRPEDSMIKNIPVKFVKSTINKYAMVFTQEVIKHINGLETDMAGSDQTAEMAARCKVREHLKKLVPSVQMIVNETLTREVVPETEYGGILRIYGVPFLPTRDKCESFLRPFSGKQFRSQHLYNCIHVQVPNVQAPVILAADGTVIDGRRLVIRKFLKEKSKDFIKLVNTVMRKGAPLSTSPDDPGDVDKEDEGEMENEDAWEIWEEEK